MNRNFAVAPSDWLMGTRNPDVAVASSRRRVGKALRLEATATLSMPDSRKPAFEFKTLTAAAGGLSA